MGILLPVKAGGVNGRSIGLTLHSLNGENLKLTREGVYPCAQDPPPTDSGGGSNLGSCFFASCAIALLNDFPIDALESTKRDLRTYYSRADKTAEGRCREEQLTARKNTIQRP